MIRNVGIFIFDDAEVLDFAGPFEVFSVTSQINDEKVFNVFTVARTRELVTAVNGLLVSPSFSFENHPPIDILIIAGGQGTRKLLNDEVVLDWINKRTYTAELTLSICSASRVVGILGLLDDKPYCTHHEVYEHMSKICPEGIPQKEKRFVQSSERLYTSGGISAGIDLSFHIVAQLLGQKTANSTARYMEYNLHSLITHHG